jgi:PleD family two-component response regulator
MSPDTERRTQRDRRRTTRGGRRPGDPTGYDPLILVADEDASNGARCVAILAKLRFAVAPAHTVEEAVKAMEALRPDLIVARLADEPVLREHMAANPAIGQIPLITMTAQNDDPAVLIEEIRRALHV